MPRPTVRVSLALVVAVVAVVACAGAGRGVPGAGQGAARVVLPEKPWPVKTREHVDLWLHGFAMVSDDNATPVPLFRRGYKDALTVEKNRRGLLTRLDESRAELAQGYKANRGYEAAQFFALYFGSLAELLQAGQIYLKVDGEGRKAETPEARAVIALFASAFPEKRDRAWLKLFLDGLLDEEEKFYHEYWLAEQRARGPALAAAEQVWLGVRPRLQPFLSGTKQPTGDLVLSLPLEGEGRTVKEGQSVVIATSYPATPAQGAEATYTFVHDAVATLAATQVADQTSPAQKRDGTADRMLSAASVRGGAMLLAAASADLVNGYARFYLQAAGRGDGGANPLGALERTFPIPDAVRDGMRRQIDILLGGI
ncbi:MAG: hypothetical protein HYX65_07815 [Gemmatimonadetes bacterium]|nr:hypothetical protein [Gemmatimonadota bacterium]